MVGSERAAAVAGKPQRLEECKAINASLAALGNCVAALAKGRPHVPYRDSKLTRLLSASLGGAARTSLVAALVPGGDAGGESRSTLEFAGRAARVAVRAAPAEVAVDYEALHAEAAARVDALEERATDLALENERLTVEDDALHAKVRAAEDRADALARRLEAADARLDAARRSRLGDAASGADAVDAIEALHERWAKETDLLETRHADALANAKRRAEERVAAYRSAADAAAADGDRAEEELTAERVGHLETLESLNKTKRALADAEKRGAARVGELLAELQDLRDASEDLEAALARERAAAADAAATLFDRVARLEASAADDQRARDENYVDRATVAEMERLFESTVEKLTGRLADLEDAKTRLVAGGRARENMSSGAKQVLDSLDAGADLPNLQDRRGRARGVASGAKANAARQPSFAAHVKGAHARRNLPQPPRFY